MSCIGFLVRSVLSTNAMRYKYDDWMEGKNETEQIELYDENEIMFLHVDIKEDFNGYPNITKTKAEYVLIFHRITKPGTQALDVFSEWKTIYMDYSGVSQQSQYNREEKGGHGRKKD
jgi:hypothetical protein